MSLYRKVRAVEKVFSDLEKDLASFKSASGLSCLKGCGLCCYKPNIAATTLEFLPLAYSLFKQSKAKESLEILQSRQGDTLCFNLIRILENETDGSCGNYQHRGLICRLFGYSAMLDKNGKPLLVTCKPIKENLSEKYNRTINEIDKGMKVPVMRDYYYRLRFIDPDLGTELLPINKAIESALKLVLGYYSYRSPRKAG